MSAIRAAVNPPIHGNRTLSPPIPPGTDPLVGHPRVMLAGEIEGAARRLAGLLSESPLQPIWDNLFSGRLDCGHLALPGVGNVGLFLADDNDRLVRALASIDATHLLLCYSASRLERPETLDTIDRLTAVDNPLSIAVIVVGIPQPDADRRFLRRLHSRGAHWPVYRVLANDLVAVRQVARLVLG